MIDKFKKNLKSVITSKKIIIFFSLLVIFTITNIVMSIPILYGDEGIYTGYDLALPFRSVLVPLFLFLYCLLRRNDKVFKVFLAYFLIINFFELILYLISIDIKHTNKSLTHTSLVFKNLGFLIKDSGLITSNIIMLSIIIAYLFNRLIYFAYKKVKSPLLHFIIFGILTGLEIAVIYFLMRILKVRINIISTEIEKTSFYDIFKAILSTFWFPLFITMSLFSKANCFNGKDTQFSIASKINIIYIYVIKLFALYHSIGVFYNVMIVLIAFASLLLVLDSINVFRTLIYVWKNVKDESYIPPYVFTNKPVYNEYIIYRNLKTKKKEEKQKEQNLII